MSNFLKITTLGIAHGLSDCAAGLMIGMLSATQGGEVTDTGMLVVLYNALAFVGQVPAGMIVDRLGSPKKVVVLSLAMVVGALCLFTSFPTLAIVLAGVAGAFFHVSGGMLALLAFPGSTVGAGLFAAPGVMGISAGAYMAWAGVPALLPLAGLAAGVAMLIAALNMGFMAVPRTQAANETFEWHDALMVVLLLAIALRSAVWNLFEVIQNREHELLLWMGAAAMTGKVVGGFAANRLGWRRYGMLAMLAAAPLLAIGGTRPATLLPGILLLQSATPSAVLGMWRLMPRLPATAIGMCFGLAIAVGGIPIMVGWNPAAWTVLLALPLSAMGYWWAMRKT